MGVGEIKDQKIGNQRGLTSVRRGTENNVITNTTDEQNVEISKIVVIKLARG